MTSHPFVPRDYQRAMIEAAYARPRSSWWCGMGSGKTSAALSYLDGLDLVDGSPTLVLAPLRVAVSTWPDEAAKWSELAHLEIVPVVGTPAQRAAALQREAPIYTMNYENVPWLVEHLGDRWPFGKVIADESTRLKSFRMSAGGVRAGALRKIAHERVRYWLNLTGTPAPNGLLDLWGPQWFVDQGARLGRSFEAFKCRWFQPVPGTDGYQQWRPHGHSRREIEERLRDCCLSIEAGDFMDLPELVENTILVDLPPRARQAYDELEREMFTALASGHEVEAFNAAARTIKCLQLCSGALYVEPDIPDDAAPKARKWVELHDQKLQALESVIAEAAGEPVLVAYHFKSDLARLQKAFPRARVLDHDPRTLREWNAGKIPLLLAHPQSAGHGLNLQDGGRILVFFSSWWSLEERQQIVERIGPTRQAQSGHPRTVYVHSIIAADTVDEIVLERHRSKREVQALLVEAMKHDRGEARGGSPHSRGTSGGVARVA